MSNRIVLQERRLARLRKQARQDVALATTDHEMVVAMSRLVSTAHRLDNLAIAA